MDLAVAIRSVLGQAPTDWFFANYRDPLLMAAASEWVNSAIDWRAPRSQRDRLILVRNIFGWAASDGCPGHADALEAAKFLLEQDANHERALRMADAEASTPSSDVASSTTPTGPSLPTCRN